MSSITQAERRDITRAAARWLALLDAEDCSEDDRARLAHWRSSNPEHEQAWQRALQLRQRFAGLPSALSLAALDRPDLGRRVAVKRVLGACALLPAGWLVGRQLPVQAWTADVHTATGEQQRMPLAEGIELQLNTDSAVNLQLAERRLTLVRGELALSAAGDQPLSIILPQAVLTLRDAEVCVRRFDDHCRIAVARGRVQLAASAGASELLDGGQQVSVSAGGLSGWTAYDPTLPDWRQGVLLADNQPLGGFLRELRRYRPGVLRWDPALERLRVTGSFRLDDTDRVLALLAASLPLSVQTRTRYWVSLAPRQENA